MSVVAFACLITLSVMRIYTVLHLAQVSLGIVALQGAFLGLHGTAGLITIERTITCGLAFLVWLRSIKYTMQIPGVGIIGRTIVRATPQARTP